MNVNISTKNLDRTSSHNLRVFEQARESTLTLLALKKFLTSSELETLEILLDKESINQTSQSLEEAKQGKLEPLENILK